MRSYRRWTICSNSCNPTTPCTPNYHVSYFGVGSLLWMNEINQTLRAGTKIRNHNVEILGDMGLPTTHASRVWIICRSTVSCSLELKNYTKHTSKSKLAKHHSPSTFWKLSCSKSARCHGGSTWRSQIGKSTPHSLHFWTFKTHFPWLQLPLPLQLHYSYSTLRYTYNYSTLHYTTLHYNSLHRTTVHTPTTTQAYTTPAATPATI